MYSEKVGICGANAIPSHRRDRLRIQAGIVGTSFPLMAEIAPEISPNQRDRKYFIFYDSKIMTIQKYIAA
jgi:hypothetical protein